MFRNIDQTADNIYLNLSFKNDSNSATSPATFNATYNQPLLDRPSDYYMTVVKFEIPLQTLPLLVLPLISPQERALDAVKGRVTQVGTAVSGFGTEFNQLMIGGTITHSGGSAIIASVQNPNTLVTATPLATTNDSYTITYSLPATQLFNLNSGVIGICPNNQPGSKAGVAPYLAQPSFTENVIFEPANQFIDQNDVRYSYVYSYEVLVQLTNNALRAAWIKAGSPGGVDACPFTSYDPETSFINVLMPAAFVNENVISGGLGWTVCWNSVIQTTVPSYPIYLSNDPAFPNGRFEINTNQFQGVELPGPVPSATKVGYDRFFIAPSTIFPTTTYIVTQDYQTVDYINSVRKIVLVSNSAPIRKEYFPPPNTVNSGASNTIPVLTDFQLNLDATAGAQRSVALYEADLYRLIDMISDSPMHKLDIQIFWADQNNNLYPLFLTQNDSATLKIGFLSKKLYKGSPMVKKTI